MEIVTISKHSHALQAILAALCIGGCASGADAKPAETESTSRTRPQRVCDSIKDFAKICYDVAERSSCASLRASAEDGAAKRGADASLQQDFGKICERACVERKAGHSWSEISARLDCATF
ncbi:hypothetical protein BH09MYX1_BH09MYX1_35070 [soil metagenome]